MPNFIAGHTLDLVLGVVLIALLLATALLSLRLARAETRLTEADRKSAEIALERDGVLVELVRTHSVVARLEEDVIREQQTRQNAAGLRVVASSTELERFEAAAEAHEARMKALLAADPTAVESRLETASRLINDALNARRT